MEAVKNITSNFEEPYEGPYMEREQESLLLVGSTVQEAIFQPENGPNLFFKGLISAVLISLFMWAIIIWVIF